MAIHRRAAGSSSVVIGSSLECGDASRRSLLGGGATEHRGSAAAYKAAALPPHSKRGHEIIFQPTVDIASGP